MRSNTSYSNLTLSKYPYLGVPTKLNAEGKGIDKLIVLFIEPAKGVVVDEGTTSNNKLGTFASSWAEEMFEPLAGSVTLSN